MRLERLDIVRLPGIDPGFRLDGLAPGVNLIQGPNASGKSSLVRALRAALYTDEARGERVHVEAAFDDGAEAELVAHRLGPDLHFTREGARVAAPPLPERRLLACYSIGVEDLVEAGETDAAIAERIARELAGGYDLPAVRERAPFALKANHGRAEARQLQAAERELRQCQQAQQRLQRDESRLAELQRDEAEAQRAQPEAERHERALELLAARRERRSLERQLAEFPEGMDNLRGDESERLRTQTQRRGELEQELAAARRRRGSANDELATTGLAEATIDAGRLSEARHHIQRLQQRESELAAQAREFEAAAARRRDAVAALGGTPETPIRLEPATLRRIEDQLADKRLREAHITALTAEQEQLDNGSCEAEPDVDALARARDELRRWLAAPVAPGWNAPRIAGAAAVIVAGMGAAAVAAVTAHPGWSVLALLVVAGAVGLAWVPDGARERRTAQGRFAETSVTGPSAWQRGAVEQRLAALEQALIDAERRARARRRREELERRLAAERSELERVRTAVQEAVSAEVGFDVEHLDLGLDRWLQLTSDWDRQRADAEAAAAERDRLANAVERDRATVIQLLTDYDEAPAETEPSAETLGDRLERLSDRLGRRDEGQRAIAAADDDIARLERELTEIDDAIRTVYTDAGLTEGDTRELDGRLERLEAWTRVRDQLRDARAREADRAEQLGEREDLVDQVEADDEAGLRQRLETLHERAGELEGLIAEITRIREAIARADAERARERAHAEHQRAADALRERVDEALYAEAGRFLLDRVEAEHQQAVQPEALRQAQDWFARFTHHAFALEFGASDGDHLQARETGSGERRALAKLSSGTRAQLLLAVRIAFTREAERGREALPLVLDEALTTSDPERFHAVAESLTTLAEAEGRQIFYLTAQPDDAAYWAAHTSPKVIDLARLRIGQSAVVDAETLALPERTSAPAPQGASAAEYAVTLGVPPIDPWAAPEAIHVFHLLRDDLEHLHRLVELGVDRLGALAELLAGEAGGYMPSEERAELAGRIEGARRWLAARRRGRGRPVDREALERSAAVSETFLDRVAELNKCLGGEGRALIDALAQGRVRRFQSDKRQALEQWLTEHGYIDEREPATAAEIELQAAGALEAAIGDTNRARRLARTLIDALEAGLADTWPGT